MTRKPRTAKPPAPKPVPTPPPPPMRLSTGVEALDALLGEGLNGQRGYPVGRIVELYGPPGAGKRTLALHAIASLQQTHASAVLDLPKALAPRTYAGPGVAAYLDASHSLDIGYAKACGVDVQQLLVSQPDSLEQLFDILETIVRSAAVHLIVVDDVAALRPTPEGDPLCYVDPLPQLMARFLRKLTAVVERVGCVVLFVNQLRPLARPAEGSPLFERDTGTGGNALKYYASIRLDVRMRREHLHKEGLRRVGHVAEIKVTKNKTAPPFKRCEVDIYDGQGVVPREAVS